MPGKGMFHQKVTAGTDRTLTDEFFVCPEPVDRVAADAQFGADNVFFKRIGAPEFRNGVMRQSLRFRGKRGCGAGFTIAFNRGVKP